MRAHARRHIHARACAPLPARVRMLALAHPTRVANADLRRTGALMEPRRAEPSRAAPSRAEPSRAFLGTQGRAWQPARAERARVHSPALPAKYVPSSLVHDIICTLPVKRTPLPLRAVRVQAELAMTEADVRFPTALQTGAHVPCCRLPCLVCFACYGPQCDPYTALRPYHVMEYAVA